MDRARCQAGTGPSTEFLESRRDRQLWIHSVVSLARIMLSILVLTALLLAVAVTQAILTVFGRRHAGKFCVANRWDADAAAGVVHGDNHH
jgi:hypothetical protein